MGSSVGASSSRWQRPHKPHKPRPHPLLEAQPPPEPLSIGFSAAPRHPGALGRQPRSPGSRNLSCRNLRRQGLGQAMGPCPRPTAARALAPPPRPPPHRVPGSRPTHRCPAPLAHPLAAAGAFLPSCCLRGAAKAPQAPCSTCYHSWASSPSAAWPALFSPGDPVEPLGGA